MSHVEPKRIPKVRTCDRMSLSRGSRLFREGKEEMSKLIKKRFFGLIIGQSTLILSLPR